MRVAAKWPVVNGQRVTTNSVMEDALGLTGLIGGWGQEGFYQGHRWIGKHWSPVPVKEIKAQINRIDWARVALVQNKFDIKMGRGVVMLTDHVVLWITETRYQRLMRHCFKSVDSVVFEREIQSARRAASGRGNISGSL